MPRNTHITDKDAASDQLRQDVSLTAIKPHYEDDVDSGDSSRRSPVSARRRLLIFLGFVAVALAGYGSATGWFGLASQAPKSDDGENSSLADALSSQLDQASLESEPSDSTTVSLPPLEPIVARDSQAVLDEGRRVVNHLFASASGSLDAVEMKARFEYEFGDRAKAKELWSQIVQSNPKYVYALRGLGDIATAEANFDEAIRYYRQAVLADPRNLNRQVTLAKALATSGKLDEAVEQWNAILLANPNYVPALHHLGQAELLRKNYEQARDAFLSALELDPKLAESQYGLAQAYIRLNDTEKASEHRKLHAELLEAKKAKIKEGRENYDDVAALKIDMGTLYTDIARVYLETGNEPAAEILLVRACRMNPENIEPRRALAWLALSRQRKHEAIRWLSEALKLQPGDFTLASEIARLYLELERMDDAVRTLEGFEQENPDNSQVVEYLSQIYANFAQDLPKAVTYAKLTVEKSPGAGTYSWLSRLLEQQGEFEAAIEAMEKAIELDPGNAELLQLLALLREKKATTSNK